MAMEKSSPEKEDKESIQSNYVPKHTPQVVIISSMVDGIFNEQLRHRSMICMFPPQCEGPVSYQTMAEDQVAHTGQDNSESERDTYSENSNGSEQLKVSI